MHLGKLKIKGRPMFSKETEFDFAKKGLTVVHGLNLNAGSGIAATNAAGKSLLFSNLQDLIYPDVLVGSRRDRVTSGYASLEIGKSKKDMHVLSSKKSPKDKTHSLDISKDGVSLGLHGKALIDSWLKAVVPPSIEAYSTLCHIDDRTPHPLVRGESSARKSFFSKFFELDSTDSLRKLCSLNLSEIKAESALLKDRKDRLAAIQDNLLDSVLLKSRVKKLELKKDVIQKEVDYYTGTQSLREFMKEHPDLEDVPDLKALRKRIRWLEEYLDSVSEHSEYLLELKQYKLSRDKRSEYIAEHNIETSLEEAEEELAAQVAIRGKKQDTDRTIEDLLTNLANLKDSKPSDPSLTCDECGADLVGDIKKKHEETYLARLSKWKKQVVDLKEQGRQLRSLTFEFDVESAKKLYDLVKKIPDLTSKPAKVEVDISLDVDEAKKELRKSRALYEQFEWALTPLFEKAKAADKELVNLPNPTTQYLSLTENLATSRANLETALSQDKELLELTNKVQSSEARLNEAQVFEILERAYGPTGFRRMLINTICSNLEQVINKYSKGLFPEDYRFELSLEKQFDILVNRTHGASESISDVRKLSGAESSMFSLLLWIGLMSFVPKARRPNFLILDELDSRMGQDSLDRFLAFIPKLLQVVDHVIVITPKSEIRYEDYVPKVSYITVVKRGLSSSIHEGKVSEVAKTIRNKK